VRSTRRLDYDKVHPALEASPELKERTGDSRTSAPDNSQGFEHRSARGKGR
jgi:hypothetical protein